MKRSTKKTSKTWERCQFQVIRWNINWTDIPFNLCYVVNISIILLLSATSFDSLSFSLSHIDCCWYFASSLSANKKKRLINTPQIDRLKRIPVNCQNISEKFKWKALAADKYGTTPERRWATHSHTNIVLKPSKWVTMALGRFSSSDWRENKKTKNRNYTLPNNGLSSI